MKTVQRLPDHDSLRRVNIESGVLNKLQDVQLSNTMAVTYGTKYISANNYYDMSHYVLEATSSNAAQNLVLQMPLNDIFEEDDIGEIFVFSFSIYSEQSFRAEVKLYNKENDTVIATDRTVQGGAWVGVRSNQLKIEDVSELSDYEIKITIFKKSSSPTDGPPQVRISNINLVNDQTWIGNPVIQSMRPYIPGFYESYDSLQTEPDYPFFRFVDVLTDAISDVMFLYSDWFEIETRELVVDSTKNDISTKSRLTNYTAIRPENLNWVSQFSGSKPRAAINNSYPLSADLGNFQQWQLNPAGYGRGAGTQSALKESVKFVLSGTKSVVIGQRYAGNPWAISITTLASETPVDSRSGVRVASTANINISTGLVNGTTIDGITVSTGDRVLLKNQSSASENGVYVVVSSGAASRATDFDSSGEITQGAVFIVSEGASNGDKAFEMVTSGTINVGTTGILFSEYLGSPDVYDAVEPARPLGYSIRHKITESFTLTLGDSIFGRLGTAVL